MSLSPGARLGPYEVAGLLGAGGMGEVYRARDTKLARDVALKVLPESVAADPQRLARFEREAQVLASLNHPNIGGIHGLVEETADGGAPVRALVLELIEGPTLADRIASGALPLDEALPIARQIAEALEAAHEQGIVHRDLKPANVKVRPDGAVKVLDFGLAKALSGAALDTSAVGSAAADSPTLTALATQAGVILGTAAYMAPEQARGKPVDRRADIWAFGVVLFEMLTGRRAFGGETVGDVLTAVIRDAPDLALLPAGVPPRVRELLARSLEKDPRQRLRDIGEARVALAQPAGSAVRSVTDVQVPTARTVPAWRRLAPWVVAAVAIGVAAWSLLRPAPFPAERALAFGVVPPPGYVLAQDDTTNLDVSRDGRTLVFAAEGSKGGVLFRRELDRNEAIAIPGTAGAVNPFFSPDGRWVGFFADGQLKKVPVGGGTPTVLARLQGYRGAAWSERGWIVYAGGYATGLFRVPDTGGPPVPVTTLDEATKERSHRWPTVIPGGAWVLFTVGEFARPNAYDESPIHAVNVDTGERRPIFTGARMVRFAGPGALLASRGTSLLAARFDPRQVEAARDVRVVREDLGGEASSGAAYFAASQTGVLALVPGAAIPQDRSLVTVTPDGQESALALEARAYHQPRFSPDGTRLAVAIGSGQAENDELWIHNLASGQFSRFTFSPGTAVPAWSPDGRWIAFARGRDASGQAMRNGIFKKAADGSTDELVVSTLGGGFPDTWTPDGRALTATSLDQGTQALLLPSQGGEPTTLAFDQSESHWGATVSPDGRHIAYVSLETGVDEVFVQSWPLGRGKWQVSVDGGRFPVWAPNGKRIFYERGGALMAVDLSTAARFEAGRPYELFRGPYVLRTAPIRNFDVGPGDRFVLVRRRTEGVAARPLEVAVGWENGRY